MKALAVARLVFLLVLPAKPFNAILNKHCDAIDADDAKSDCNNSYKGVERSLIIPSQWGKNGNEKTNLTRWEQETGLNTEATSPWLYKI